MEDIIFNESLDILNIMRNQMDIQCYLQTVLNPKERAILNLHKNRVVTIDKKKGREHQYILNDQN